MLKKFNRKTNNLIAALRGLPPDRSRARLQSEQDMGKVMDAVIRQYEIDAAKPEEAILAEWPHLVGEHNARHTRPWKLDRSNRLFVAVSNPVVKQELQFHKKLILERIGRLPGCGKIRQIIFRAG